MIRTKNFRYPNNNGEMLPLELRVFHIEKVLPNDGSKIFTYMNYVTQSNGEVREVSRGSKTISYEQIDQLKQAVIGGGFLDVTGMNNDEIEDDLIPFALLQMKKTDVDEVTGLPPFGVETNDWETTPTIVIDEIEINE
jgi:hypothetical protein